MSLADTIARIEADPLGAIVHICADAAADQPRPGPLAGMPFTAKDVLATAGVPSQAGSVALRGHIPRDDAPAVALLRAAGAVLVAKTNCSELALSPWTGNPLFGETAHPSIPDRSPGGSSGGCAAAIATGLVPVSLGTDYGGSIRLPAAACGIVGLRPTPGRVPAEGQLPPPAPGSPRERFSIVGPQARDLAHLRMAFEALDAHAAPAASKLPDRVAVAGEAPELRRIATLLDRAGIETVSTAPPFLAAAEECFTVWRSLDTFEDLRPIANRLGPELRALVASAPAQRDEIAHRRLERQAESLRSQADEFLSEHQILILLVARCELPPPAGAPVPFDDLGPCRAISLLELPAVSIGGVQLVAQRGCDEHALELAAKLERLLEGGERG